MFDSKRARVAALFGALAVAAVAGGTAIAAPGTDAPHIRVAGVVNADGSVWHSKGITRVSRPRTGVYCVQTTIPDVRYTVALATSWNYGRIISAFTTRHAECGNRANAVRVTLVDRDLRTVNAPFTIAVP